MNIEWTEDELLNKIGDLRTERQQLEDDLEVVKHEKVKMTIESLIKINEERTEKYEKKLEEMEE